MSGFLRAFSARFLSIAAVAAALIIGVAVTPAHAIVVPWSVPDRAASTAPPSPTWATPSS